MCLFHKYILTYTHTFERYAGIWVFASSKQTMILQKESCTYVVLVFLNI